MGFGRTPDSSPAHEETRNRGGFHPFTLFLLAVCVLAVAGFFAARALARRPRLRSLLKTQRDAQRLYRDLERVLARRGAGRPPHVSPEAHARALRTRGFIAAEAVRELTEVYLASRYGAADLSAERLRRARERLSEIKRAA